MDLKAVIFDIDGTLANTLPVCIEAYRATLQHYAQRPFTTEEITRYFGTTEEGILSIYIPESMPKAVDTYFAFYEEMHHTCREPFPGIFDAVKFLHARRVPLAVVTGKGARGAEVTLQKIGLLPYLSAVESGSDQGPNKPECLLRVLQKLGLRPNEAVYIGDTAYDLQAAASVGVPVIGAAWANTTTIQEQDASLALHVFHQVQDFTTWLMSTFNHHTVSHFQSASSS